MLSGARSVAYRAPTITLNAGFSVAFGTEFSAWNYNCAQFTSRSTSEQIEDESVDKSASQITSSDYKLTVAPNPASDFITVSFELQNQEQVSLNIIDVKGSTVQSLITRKMIEKGSHTQSFQILVPSGLYFIAIEGTTSRQTQKVIVH
jgi:Secretion system C-terminal sorting domain